MKLKKTDYQTVAMACSILGAILGFDGLVTGLMLTSPTMLDHSTFFSFYYYGSILASAGITLILVGLGFGWQASQEK